MSVPTALQQALRLQQQPDLLTVLQHAPLPPRMSELIRIAMGEGVADVQEREAAAHFLQQVCLHADADPRRRLALSAGDGRETARTHHRLLIKWLHPDRKPDAQRLAERVNSAWTALKNSPELPIMAFGLWDWPVAISARRSRFPLFLGTLLLAALLLLGVSLLPEVPVYGNAVQHVVASSVPAVTSSLRSPAQLAAAPQATRLNPASQQSVAVIPLSPKQRVVAQTRPSIAVMAATERAHMPAMLGRPAALPAPISETPVAEPPVAEVPASTATLPASISAVEASGLLQQFRMHYGNGDLSQFMALFSAKAVSLKGGRQAISKDYAQVFNSTLKREITLNHPHWQTLEDARRLRAGFQTELTYDGRVMPIHRRGTIEMLFVREQGQPRILELLVTE